MAAILVPTGPAAGQLPQGSPPDEVLRIPTPEVLRAHVSFLADDLLEGRAAGTRGERLAARYIATQFALAGLEPAGTGGTYFQPVDLVGLASRASLVAGAGRRTVTLRAGDEMVAWPEQPESSLVVDAPLVFVGYGVQAPEWNWDDFRDAPLGGRILLILAGDPGARDTAAFDARALTIHGTVARKLEQARRLGAAGALLVHDGGSALPPWEATRNTWSRERLLPLPATEGTLRFAAWITDVAARRLLETGEVDYDLLVRRASRRDFAPIELGLHAAVHLRSVVRPVRTLNVVARLPGADPGNGRLGVVYTAHYDHLGTASGSGRDDRTFNGARDNASGVAVLLAIASAYAGGGPAPARSVVFLATSAAEPWLLGARAYVADPALPLEHTLAVFNVDGANLYGPATDAAAAGAELSTLGETLARAAAAESLQLVSDPLPEWGRFFDSDHFPFAAAGVPAVRLVPGPTARDRPPDWLLEREITFREERDHRPSDEIAPDLDYRGAAQQARVLIRAGWEVLAGGRDPVWLPGTRYRPAGERLRLKRSGGMLGNNQ